MLLIVKNLTNSLLKFPEKEKFHLTNTLILIWNIPKLSLYYINICKKKCFHTNRKTSLIHHKKKRPTQISFTKISSYAKRSYINVNPINTIGKGQSKKPYQACYHLHKSRKRRLWWAMKSLTTWATWLIPPTQNSK